MNAFRQRISVFLLAAGCWCGMSPSCGVAQSSYTGGSFSTLLPTSWKTLNAVEPVGNVIYVAGGGDGGGKLGVYDTTAGKFSDLSNVLPASWSQGIRTISCGDNMLLIGGQGPSRIGLYSLTSQNFQDLTSKLTDYHYGLNAAAFNGSQFLIGGAGFNTSIQLVSPAGQFTSLAPKIPFYFAVNTAVPVGGSIFIAGAGPGPGSGQPPALGSVAADGSFTDLTHSLPSGWGASWHSAYNGSVLFLQGFDSASGAHQLLALFNPTSKAATDVTASFPASFQLHGSGGGNGNFLIGGQLNGSAYLALYTPGSTPTAFTSVLPAGAQDVTAIKIAGSGFVIGGVGNGGQIFLVGGQITTISSSSTGILAPTSSSSSQPPNISTVLVSAVPGPNLAMSIFGSGFGTTTSFVGTKSFLKIKDLTGKWEAGHSGDGVNVNVTKWTDSEIVISNFSGFDFNELGTGNNSFKSFDQVEVDVQNAGNPGQTATSTVWLPAYLVVKIGPSPNSQNNYYVVLNNTQIQTLVNSIVTTLQRANLCGQQPEVNISVGKASNDTARDLEILEFMIDLPDMAASGIQFGQDIEELGVGWAALNLANNQWTSLFPDVPSIALEGVTITLCQIDDTIKAAIQQYNSGPASIIFGHGEELRISVALNALPTNSKLDVTTAALNNTAFTKYDYGMAGESEVGQGILGGQAPVLTFSDVDIPISGYVIDAQGYTRSDISVIVSSSTSSGSTTPSSSAGPASTSSGLTVPQPPTTPHFP